MVKAVKDEFFHCTAQSVFERLLVPHSSLRRVAGPAAIWMVSGEELSAISHQLYGSAAGLQVLDFEIGTSNLFRV